MPDLEQKDKVYLWRTPDRYPMKWLGVYLSETSPDYLLFQRGQPLQDNIPIPSFRFEVTSATLKGLDVLPNNIRVPLISSKVADFLNRCCPEDVQLLRCDVSFKDCKSADYFLVNVFNRVACIDRNQSKFSLIPGTPQIMSFRTVRLKASCMGPHCLVRAAEYTPFILVSQALKTEFDTNGWKACAFVNPEEM